MTRFDRFMQSALYHPERGYYSKRIKTVGSRGDFTTTAQLSNILARAIAQTFSQSGFRHLIEVGPGTGQLAHEIRKALPFLTRRKTQHHLVEVSEPLRKLQQEKLPKAHHHTTIDSALKASQGEAFIYSNELVDAFPVRIFQKEHNHWSELHLSGSQGAIEEHFIETETLPESKLFRKELPHRQRIEVHESYLEWLQNWTPNLLKGQLLTIDYTTPSPRLIPGTLRGYFLQDRLTGPNLYQNAGHIDLTADVEFDDLENWGQKLGFKTRLRQSQRDFLLPFSKGTPQDNFLTDSQGAGTAFEVLLQTVSR